MLTPPAHTLTCSVPGGASSQSVSLQQNNIGHPHFGQVVDGLTAQAASSNHHHVGWPVAVGSYPQVSWGNDFQTVIRTKKLKPIH